MAENHLVGAHGVLRAWRTHLTMLTVTADDRQRLASQYSGTNKHSLLQSVGRPPCRLPTAPARRRAGSGSEASRYQGVCRTADPQLQPQPQLQQGRWQQPRLQCLPRVCWLLLFLSSAATLVAAQEPICPAGSYYSGAACVSCPAGFTSFGGSLRPQSCLPNGTLQGPLDTSLGFPAEEADGVGDYTILPAPAAAFAWAADRFGRTGGAAFFPASPVRLLEHTSPAVIGRVPVGNAPRTVAAWFKTVQGSGTGFVGVIEYGL